MAGCSDTLPDLIANGTTFADWVYVRTTENHYSNAPVRRRLPARLTRRSLTLASQITDVNSTEFRCYELDMNATPGETQIATVEAGSTIGFKGM